MLIPRKLPCLPSHSWPFFRVVLTVFSYLITLITLTPLPMRFKSNAVDGYTIYAVAGTNTVSFAIDFTHADTNGLLGFAVKRKDPAADRQFYMYNYKVFKDVVPNPKPNTPHSSYDFPIQSFVWDDPAAKENTSYEYTFYPVKGHPKNLKYGNPILIKVQTEPTYDKNNQHDVFFNRGVASSQAYALKFGNQKPDQIKDEKLRKEAMQWLSRDLDEAMIKFIESARKGDTILGCFYEFRHLPVLEAFKKAIDRGVHVTIIHDCKKNGTPAKGNKKATAAFPREDNLKMISKAKIPAANLIKRESNKNDIQHNKFMVLLKGAQKKPSDVWFGSTNLSQGGIHGQTNVGHWIKDHEVVAGAFEAYWRILESDPGKTDKHTRSEGMAANKVFKRAVSDLQDDLNFTSLADIPDGETCFFSPRASKTMLNVYSQILDAADKASCITLAFGVNTVFKDLLKDNNAQSHITYMLLEKKDKPTEKNKDTFVYLNSKNNVYKAFGAYLKDPLYQWTREVNTQIMGLNSHVKYIHSKFLLADPLSDEPVVITGSANFSEPSTISNDENMVIIKGNTRVADIYFTEFMRIFQHYYFRSVFEELQRNEATGRGELDEENRVFLCPDDEWLDKYKPGSFKHKRMKVFAAMSGAVTLP